MDVRGRVERYLAEATGQRRGRQFAAKAFGGCQAHLKEAIAVYIALEQLATRRLTQVRPESTIGDVLLTTRALQPNVLSIEQMAELAATVEAKWGDSTSVGEIDETLPLELEEFWARLVQQTLLGPAASHTTWDPPTIWLRSVRGVINERVRRLGDCTCAGSRPTSALS
jgi:hypothetical protein